MVIVDIFHQCAEGIAAEKPDREPGGIGSKAQNVEGTLGVQLQFLAGKALSQIFQRGMQIPVAEPFWKSVAK